MVVLRAADQSYMPEINGPRASLKNKPMKKVIFQFLVLLALFLCIWLILGRIDFEQRADIKGLSKANEKKLGELISDLLKRTHKEVEEDSVLRLVDSIKTRICLSNNIPSSEISVHVLASGEVNAFALPDRHLVICSGLIGYCRSAEELSGVIAHEIAHMENNHITRKLVKEAGLAVLLTLAGGDSGPQILKEVARLLTSTAFDRKQESEADASAVRFLARAGIDPEHLANFLFRLSADKKGLPRELGWMSTHPDSGERTAQILRLRKKESFTAVPVTDEKTWERVKELLN
jgi:beta-barrel assembly-enhancing protease